MLSFTHFSGTAAFRIFLYTHENKAQMTDDEEGGRRKKKKQTKCLKAKIFICIFTSKTTL